jgi:hypothetical protein
LLKLQIAEIEIKAVVVVMERPTNHQTTKTSPVQAHRPVLRLALIREREIQSCHTPATNSSGWMIWKSGALLVSWA